MKHGPDMLKSIQMGIFNQYIFIVFICYIYVDSKVSILKIKAFPIKFRQNEINFHLLFAYHSLVIHENVHDFIIAIQCIYFIRWID